MVFDVGWAQNRAQSYLRQTLNLVLAGPENVP